MNCAKLFLATYCTELEGAVVHDLRAPQDSGASLRDVMPPHLEYVRVDFVAPAAAEAVPQDRFELPFEDASLDVLVCSACLAHTPFFWLLFLEMLRVLKPHGLLYVKVPGNVATPGEAMDCWRFNPDAGRALEAWARQNGYASQLLESFVGEGNLSATEAGASGPDFVAVFVKDARQARAYPARMLDALPTASSGYDSRRSAKAGPAAVGVADTEHTASAASIDAMRQKLVAAGDRAVALLRENEQLAYERDELRRQLTGTGAAPASASDSAAAPGDAQLWGPDARLAQALHSALWRVVSPPARKLTHAARLARSQARRIAARLRPSAQRASGPGSAGTIDAEVSRIRASGMFDEAYYRAQSPELATVPDALRHYCEQGWREGLKPRATFDTAYYLKRWPDVRQQGVNPLLHYVTAGVLEGRATHPERQDRLAGEMEAIRASGRFDEAFYRAMNPDIPRAQADPVRHYCETGWREGKDPSDEFSTSDYLAIQRDIRNAGMNPFLHYVVAGVFEHRMARRGRPEVFFESDVWFGEAEADVQLLAFHAAPDWPPLRSGGPAGQGETPVLLPHEDLGFYAPAHRALVKRQAALASRHGIRGFCFPVTGQPGGNPALAAFLDTPEAGIGLCTVLELGEGALPEAGMTLVRRACADVRAVRVDGRPLVLARPRGTVQDLLPQLQQLRQALLDHGVGPVFLVACWTSGDQQAFADACAAGACDAVLDLPDPAMPRETGAYGQPQDSGVQSIPYSVVAAQGVFRARQAAAAGFPLYQAISLGRDDSRAADGDRIVYRRFHVDEYRRWLDAALDGARGIPQPERRLVFLRSWNDWNRGQVLEPDRQAGYSRLNETSRALQGLNSREAMPKVSVIVPNYNHGRFLHRRLDSIYAQTYPNIEVILLDDCSSDASRRVLDEYAAKHPEITRTLYNDSNSGGVFRQWARGIKEARGELVWIAESDDYCHEGFLETLVRSFADESVLLACGQSVFVDEHGLPMEKEFEEYVRDLGCGERWRSPYVESSLREVRLALGIKNTIPNASGVVFRRPVDMPLLDDPEWLSMKVVGDWVFYLHVMHGGKIAFHPRALNYFRRYAGSTTLSTHRQAAFFREVGLACRTVARLYDVPLSTLEHCRAGYRVVYHKGVGNSDTEFDGWFDFDAVLRARAQRLPSVMVCTMGFFPGGAEIFPIRLANEFKRQGVPVLLLSAGLHAREQGVRSMVRNDVPVVETSDPKVVKQIIEQFGIEVLNTHQWYVQKYPAQEPEVFAALRSHVATLHGMIEHGNPVSDRELRAADRWVTTWVYTAEKNVVPFREFGLLEGNESRFLKMPNGIQTPRIEAVPRADLDLPDDAFVLCCVSRAIPDKGWPETIEAVERAREISGRDIRLVLVGNGPLYDEYRRTGVPPFVHLVGFSENSAGHYASADMGIMLTRFRSESFPLTILDCLFAGKPYIATDVGDIPNMLSSEEGVAGAIIPLDDWHVPVEEAARAIAGFATDHASYQAATALVPQIARRYRIDTVAAQYIELFRGAVQAPAGTAAEREGEGESAAVTA